MTEWGARIAACVLLASLVPCCAAPAPAIHLRRLGLARRDRERSTRRRARCDVRPSLGRVQSREGADPKLAGAAARALSTVTESGDIPKRALS
jgi:hypothetical protein